MNIGERSEASSMHVFVLQELSIHYYREIRLENGVVALLISKST